MILEYINFFSNIKHNKSLFYIIYAMFGFLLFHFGMVITCLFTSLEIKWLAFFISLFGSLFLVYHQFESVGFELKKDNISTLHIMATYFSVILFNFIMQTDFIDVIVFASLGVFPLVFGRKDMGGYFLCYLLLTISCYFLVLYFHEKSRIPYNMAIMHGFSLIGIGSALIAQSYLEYFHTIQHKKASEELIKAKKQFEYLRSYDMLTGIFNRYQLDIELEKVNLSTGLLILDIDHFKQYNDYYGHHKGDECIKKVAEVLQNQKNCLVFRYGGEEFIILQHNSSRENLLSLSEKIIKDLMAVNIIHEKSETANHLTLSIGGAVFSNDMQDHNALLRHADYHLYLVKNTSRNAYSIL